MSGYEGIQVIVGMLVILGSGIASWVGVKVALAEMKQRQDNHDKDIEEIKKMHSDDMRELMRRIERIENRYFEGYNPPTHHKQS